MANEDFFEPPKGVEERAPDAREGEARAALEAFFDRHKESVFFSRQLEIRNEGEWYHWITNRALRELAGRGLIRTGIRQLQTGGSIHLMWHKSYRYHRRDATRVVRLVEEYSDPNIGGSLGLQGEAMVLEGFAIRVRDAGTRCSKLWRARMDPV